MIKIAKIYPRDIIGIIVITIGMILIAKGINSIVSGIVIMVITYYFSKRVYEIRNPNGDFNDKIDNVEKEVKEIKEANNLPAKTLPVKTEEPKPQPSGFPGNYSLTSTSP